MLKALEITASDDLHKVQMSCLPARLPPCRPACLLAHSVCCIHPPTPAKYTTSSTPNQVADFATLVGTYSRGFAIIIEPYDDRLPSVGRGGWVGGWWVVSSSASPMTTRPPALGAWVIGGWVGLGQTAERRGAELRPP